MHKIGHNLWENYCLLYMFCKFILINSQIGKIYIFSILLLSISVRLNQFINLERIYSCESIIEISYLTIRI